MERDCPIKASTRLDYYFTPDVAIAFGPLHLTKPLISFNFWWFESFDVGLGQAWWSRGRSLESRGVGR